MDHAALHELVARVRGTVAELAEAEQKVADLTAELAQQQRLSVRPKTSGVIGIICDSKEAV